MKGRVCEVSLGQKGGSSYGEVGRGMKSCGPTSQILGPTGLEYLYHLYDFFFTNEFIKNILKLTCLVYLIICTKF